MRWLGIAVALAAPVFAQTKFPVQSLSVEGLKNYTQTQTIAASGLKIGQLASKDDFEKARDRLLATGVFETVGYRYAPAGPKGYAATFDVVEVEPVYPVRIEGLSKPGAEIEAWLKRKDPFFGAKIPATETILKKNTSAIEEFLGAEKVAAKVVADAPEKFAIVFQPAAGPPKVAEVRFVGNKEIPSSTLLHSFAQTAYGTVFSKDAFRQLLDSGIKPIYEARGRIRVAFPKIEAEKAIDVEGQIVTVTVNEGEVYQLGEVRVVGETPVSPKELVKAGGFKPGVVANFDDIAAGMDQVKKRLRREGFMNASLKVDRKIDDEKKTVDLEVRPELGEKFTFGSLTIQGLDIHGEAAVKKLWSMKEGAPYNADYPDYFLAQVKQQGVFDDLGDTKSAVKVDEQSRVVDVTLNFRPASTEAGAGSRATSRRRGR